MKFTHMAMMAAALPLAACASAAAAKKTGVNISEVAACETRVCLYSKNTATLVDEKDLDNGMTQYAYRFQKRQGSYLRSLGYGIAAVGTLGMSEIVTGATESAIQNDKQFVALADCDDAGQCPRLLIVEFEKEPRIVRGATAAELAVAASTEDNT